MNRGAESLEEEKMPLIPTYCNEYIEIGSIALAIESYGYDMHMAKFCYLAEAGKSEAL
jgi:hypothetical protein